MPKVTYKQKVRDIWLQSKEFKEWLRKDPTDLTRAYCSYCKCSIIAKLCDLRAHGATKKHISSMSGFEQKNKIPFSQKATKTTEQEAALCLFVAQHSAIAPINHLSELCKEKFDDSSTASKIKLHRAKCTYIIKNALAPHFNEELHKDISNSKFSLLLDESTDVSVTKLLGVVINYFSVERGVVVSTFLSIVQLEGGDALSIADGLRHELKRLKLDIKKLIGIGTDNASVMIGNKNSVYVQLKKDAPSLILIKCVCHSVQLAVNYACKHFLPDDLEFLIYETYNWFSKSSIRQSIYKKMYECINDEKAPLKIPRVCDTRWLSIEMAVTRILDQWHDLKTHFGIAALQEKCKTAKMLYESFCDNKTHLYLLFLKPILQDMQKINKCFQSNSTNATKLLNDLILAINSLKQKIIPPDSEIDIINTDELEKHVKTDLYLGYDFEKEIKALSIKSLEEKDIRECCAGFVVELVKQLKQRLPENVNILKQIDAFSVDNILKIKKTSITPILEYFDTPNIDKIERQYNEISFVKWENVDDTIKFWNEVYKYRDSGGNDRFNELSLVALQMLVLPWSNAEVERVFSQLNLVKNKIRNRMNVDTLNAILSIRYGLHRQNKCCFDYKIPPSCLASIERSEYYPSDDIDIENIVLLDNTFILE